MADQPPPLQATYGGGSVPAPDPTLLTTQQLTREIAALREILEATIHGDRALMESRFDGMDKAVKLLQTIMDRRPAEFNESLNSLQELVEQRFNTVSEQFNGIQTQFIERDVRVRESAMASTTAVSAALQAQKEAAGEQSKSFALLFEKSEASTVKQMDQLSRTLDKATEGLSDQIADTKDRLTRIESLAVGAANATGIQRADQSIQQGSSSLVIAIVVGGAGVLVGVAGLVLALLRG